MFKLFKTKCLLYISPPWTRCFMPFSSVLLGCRRGHDRARRARPPVRRRRCPAQALWWAPPRAHRPRRGAPAPGGPRPCSWCCCTCCGPSHSVSCTPPLFFFSPFSSFSSSCFLAPMRFLQRRRAFRCRPSGWVAVIRKLKCVLLCVCGCARVCVRCSLLRRPQSPLLPRHYLRIRFAPRCPPPLPLTVWRAVHFPVLVVVKPPSPRNLLS